MANLTDTGIKAHDNTQAFPSVFNDLSEESAVGSLKLLIVSFLTELLWFNWTWFTAEKKTGSLTTKCSTVSTAIHQLYLSTVWWRQSFYAKSHSLWRVQSVKRAFLSARNAKQWADRGYVCELQLLCGPVTTNDTFHIICSQFHHC